MVDWQISAIISKPRWGNYKHWVLCADNGDKSIVYEVIGEHGTFQAIVLETDPRRSADFLESMHLGGVQNRDFKKFEKAIKATNADNETIECDCQDYVLEVLDSLEEECVIDGDDSVYQRQKRKLKNKRAEY